MSSGRLPLVAKLLFSAWILLWVPVYWTHNGWSNFLWICDFANFVTLVAIWSESALLASSQLAGILFIQVLWALDFLGRLVSGAHPIGGTGYMFEASTPWWLRALSLFHLWMIPLLVWMVRRLGHDRRGWRLETAFAALLFPAGQLLGTREQNLNWMWAPFGVEQTWMPPLLFAIVSVPVAALVLFLPGDLVVRRWLVARPGGGGGAVSPESSGTAARSPRPESDG